MDAVGFSIIFTHLRSIELSIVSTKNFENILPCNAIYTALTITFTGVRGAYPKPGEPKVVDIRRTTEIFHCFSARVPLLKIPIL